MTSEATTGWRDTAARRLQRLARALTGEPEPAAAPDALPEEYAGRELRSVVEELYPTVAPRVLALADAGVDANVDEWITVARLLYDTHMHRVGGPSIEARQRALLATLGQALEAQARSSARLAGYADEEHDRPSTFDGDPEGTLLWEHYLCPQARLARSALHGESVGDWLGALGELWSASDALYQLATDDEDADGDEGNDERAAALDRVKIALVRVQELSLW